MRKAFVERAADAIENKALGRALDANADRRQHGRHLAFASLPELESRIQKAHARRLETIHRLDFYLDQFSRSLTAHGVQVHYAPDAAVASRLVLQITQRAGAKRVVKSKSMLSEEIQLNHTLEEHGLEVVETDLGEFIVQLRGETPGHIITPAIHLTRQDVARTFNEKLAMPYSEDVADLNKHARKTLRQVFLQADLGISGVNFGVADTGTLCLVTNEGNGRMVTSLPPLHIALMGVERIVPTAQDLDLMLQLLPRSATGQKLTSYISLLGSLRQNLKTHGIVERHVILVDNGRRSLVATPLEDALLCIRCGACLNACPVFREIGGHAYGSVYPGPIGSLVSPGYFGIERFGHLAHVSTLCGACNEACPVGIDLTTLLLRTRRMYREAKPGAPGLRLGIKLYTWLATNTKRFHAAQRFAGLLSRMLPKRESWIRRLPPPLDAWTSTRDFPPFATRVGNAGALEASDEMPEAGHAQAGADEIPDSNHPPDANHTKTFAQELEAVGGEIRPVSEGNLFVELRALLNEIEVDKVLYSDPDFEGLKPQLEAAGVECRVPMLDGGLDNAARKRYLASLDDYRAGVTGCLGALADTGSLLIACDGAGNLCSLLPEIHVAILRERDIHGSLAEWLEAGGNEYLSDGASVTIVSGPSRTADIEMTLTIGVHGPRRLIVLCIE